ncbi:hypothetical protein BH11PSE2_BH11PSE2_14530 [soil metagenome]
MTPLMKTHAQVGPLAMLVAGLAAANAYLQPEKTLALTSGVAVMAVSWLLSAWLSSRKAQSTRTLSEQQYVVLAAVYGGLTLAGAYAVKLAIALGFDHGETMQRAVGVGSGLVMVVIGNVLPKVIAPVTATRCGAVHTQSLQRFAGWVFVLAGLAIAVLSFILPTGQADGITLSICLGAVVLVIGRLAWILAANRKVAS